MSLTAEEGWVGSGTSSYLEQYKLHSHSSSNFQKRRGRGSCSAYLGLGPAPLLQIPLADARPDTAERVLGSLEWRQLLCPPLISPPLLWEHPDLFLAPGRFEEPLLPAPQDPPSPVMLERGKTSGAGVAIGQCQQAPQSNAP